MQTHGFPIQTYGKTLKAGTLIVRCESKICPVKSLVSTHSACPCKNCPPKSSQIPYELDYLICFFFQASVHTKQKKNCPENNIIHLGCIVESYKASKQPRMHSRAIQSKQTTYRIRSIRRRSRIVAAPPEVLNEIVAALE